ncbi:MAG TPA: bifunctional riboflavin kinase/FAD synthetase [Pseudomonadales bacterium]|nr:bifunctional riboflavin kinase/FAD synthetase [Pseudomonadales bacterium]
MELIRDLHNIRPEHRLCVATIGAFDGVHRGHQMVIKTLVAKARAVGLPATVILFEPLPREYFRPHDAPPRLTNFAERFKLLAALGVDRVLRIHFVDAIRQMSAERFISQVFVEKLGVKYLIVGDDFAFGKGREGNFDTLLSMGQSSGFEVQDTATLEHEQERVSSSRIREALVEADFACVEHLLGRPYSMSGRVVMGQQLGRTMGAPTANIQLRRLRSPLAGVYAVEIDGIDGKRYQGVANVGTRPTIGDLSKAILEVHVFNFDGNLYGKHLEVLFRHKLRDEKKFSSLDELKNNIARDFDAGRAYFE